MEALDDSDPARSDRGAHGAGAVRISRVPDPCAGLVVWPIEFGFPSIAGEKVQSFGNVISAPVIEEPDPKALADKLVDLAKVGLFAAALLTFVKIFARK